MHLLPLRLSFGSNIQKMKYDKLPTELFVDNRKRFTAALKPNSIAIFHSNDEHPWNGDATFHFKQNSDLFWLSGIDQEDTYLLLYPDCAIPEMREVLFIKRTNETMIIWNGHKLTQAQAREVSGIQSIFW